MTRWLLAIAVACCPFTAGDALAGAVASCIRVLDDRFEICLHDPTDRYGHNVLGSYGEWEAISVYAVDPANQELHLAARTTLPAQLVFEDVSPRLGDLTGDGWPEIVTVVSSQTGGGALTVFSLPNVSAPLPLGDTFPPLRKVAATPPIGQRNRWLAPIGVADFDGDGRNDVAYVDRPHLAKVLRIWTLRDGTLVQIAEAPGFSNHKIGESFISGGIRDCGDGPEMVLPNFNWTKTMMVRMDGGEIWARPLANRADRATINSMLRCN